MLAEIADGRGSWIAALLWMLLVAPIYIVYIAEAQAVPNPGTRLRLEFRDRPGRQPATLRLVKGDSIGVWLLGRDAMIAFNQLARLEVRRGERGSAGTGAVIGLVAGVLLGAVAGAVSAEGTELTPQTLAAIGAIQGGLFGAGAGAVIGLCVRTDRWEVWRRGWSPSNSAPVQFGIRLRL